MLEGIHWHQGMPGSDMAPAACTVQLSVMQHLATGEHVVKFMDAYEDALEVHLVMELCRGTWPLLSMCALDQHDRIGA